jgi:hypothetical protein
MRNYFGLLMFAGMMVFMACGSNEKDNPANQEVRTTLLKEYEAKGDSSLYGLVCDGSDDTHLVVFFPDLGQDPDTFDITDARLSGSIFGFPMVGDKYALVVDPKDRKKVVKAINLREMEGTWVYDQMPQVRRDINLDLIEESNPEEMVRFEMLIDSLMIPREYGFTLKSNWQVMALGMGRSSRSVDKESPVEYPPSKRYTEWHIHNGNIILTSSIMSADAKNQTVANDTAQLIYLRSDTMALQFGDKVQGYRLRPDTLSQEK